MAVWLALGDWQIATLRYRAWDRHLRVSTPSLGQAEHLAVSKMAERLHGTVWVGTTHNPPYSLPLGRMFVAGSQAKPRTPQIRAGPENDQIWSCYRAQRPFF